MPFLLMILLLLPISVNAANLYIRDDGGIPILNGVGECDGTLDKAKSNDKHCAYNFYYQQMIAQTKNTDNIIISKGTFNVNVGVPDLWITEDQFYSNTKYYMNQVDRGRKVFLKSFNGVAQQIKLEKY